MDIMKRLEEHLKEALASVKRDWFVICLQGAQNYNLDDEESDIDSKLLIIPSLEDIAFGKIPYSKTHIMENEEHVDIKDIRAYFKLFEKANINFVEILFTDYWICNPKYEEYWRKLLEHREEIAYMNPNNALACMKGMALQKKHALCHEYPSRMKYIDMFGYDPKQLSHIFRIEDFVNNYIESTLYSNAIVYRRNSPRAEFIRKVKRGEVFYTKEEAVFLSERVVKDIVEKVDAEREHLSSKETNPETKKILTDILISILKDSLRYDLLEK